MPRRRRRRRRARGGAGRRGPGVLRRRRPQLDAARWRRARRRHTPADADALARMLQHDRRLPEADRSRACRARLRRRRRPGRRPATSPSPATRRSFGLSEVRLGIVAGHDLAVRGARDRRARRRARYMLTAEHFDAARARCASAWCTRSSTPTDLDATVERAASTRCCAAGPRRWRATKRLIADVVELPHGRRCRRRHRASASPTRARRRGRARASRRSSTSARRPGLAEQAVSMFAKILIANRGEIACRVIAHRAPAGHRAPSRSIPTPTRDARHVAACDEAVRIGRPPARESYLRRRRDPRGRAAHRRRRRSIPGYGFLSENADFAEACAAAGIVFIGPPAAAIRAMGSQDRGQGADGEGRRAAGAGLSRRRPGRRDFWRSEAERIGFPVLIKAVAGGGGKGMRARRRARRISPPRWPRCQREASGELRRRPACWSRST